MKLSQGFLFITFLATSDAMSIRGSMNKSTVVDKDDLAKSTTAKTTEALTNTMATVPTQRAAKIALMEATGAPRTVAGGMPTGATEAPANATGPTKRAKKIALRN